MHPVEADDVWCALRRLCLDRQWKTGRLDRASQLESQCWLVRKSSLGREVAEEEPQYGDRHVWKFS